MTNLCSTFGIAAVILVAMVTEGPKCAEVPAIWLPPAALAGRFDAVFLFYMTLEALGIALMLAVGERLPTNNNEGEILPWF